MASDLSSHAALIAAIFAAAVTGALFLYCLGLRISHIAHSRRLNSLREYWWPIFAESIAGQDLPDLSDASAKARGTRVEILREWNRFRGLVRGSSTSNLNRLAERLELSTEARVRLKRRAVGSKLLAIQAIGYLGDTASWAAIESLLNHPNIAISATAATALVNIDAKRAIPLIIPLIGQQSGWSRTQIGKLLNLAGPDLVSRRLCSAIEGSPPDTAIRLLQFADSVNSADLNRLVERLLKYRRDPGVLSAALKAARGHVQTVTVAALTRHEAWYVRMQAASLLGRCGRSEDYKILEPLLCDKEWWVRYRAAQAIVKLPLLGPNSLRKIRDRQKDRFAHDILSQALAEKGLA